MYYWYKCNDFSKKYLPFQNYRFCIENILNLNIPFKQLNEIGGDDILIIFSHDIFNPQNILTRLLEAKYKILIINTENYKFEHIEELFESINRKNNINLIDYNIVNINYIKKKYNEIKLHFLPLLYNPYLEQIYNQKYIKYSDRPIDILFCGSEGTRRRPILKQIRKNFKVHSVHHALNINLQNDVVSKSKIIINVFSYEHNKIFDYYRNSYLLANKCLLISEYPTNIDLSIEKNLIGFEDHLIFFNLENHQEVFNKYLSLNDEEYSLLVNKQYDWFKKNNDMGEYSKGIFK
jgi:hypothetical protein